MAHKHLPSTLNFPSAFGSFNLNGKFFLVFSCSSGNIALLHYAVCFVPLFLVMVSLPFIYWKAYRKGSYLENKKNDNLNQSYQGCHSGPWDFSWLLQCRGGSRIFFRRRCTRLLSTSTPINHIVLFFFSCKIPVVLENCRSGVGGGGAHPLHPPPRSAPAVYPLPDPDLEISKGGWGGSLQKKIIFWALWALVKSKNKRKSRPSHPFPKSAAGIRAWFLLISKGTKGKWRRDSHMKGACQKFWIKPLKETNLGMAQPILPPKRDHFKLVRKQKMNRKYIIFLYFFAWP